MKKNCWYKATAAFLAATLLLPGCGKADKAASGLNVIDDKYRTPLRSPIPSPSLS